ncbi:hypothetical protein L227DRAFT_404691 [Lentinus tigrinus ALCF2SS1-6]|uniref:Uncharacterized protein n=1 Tax=Lentinus tigrinus ALCF2SS1-6 TaxID=1328759 RepID=A0A5C2RSN9_9APHY|nr:hypothetical protein L227DRAFT_404691 [Lentinus tigrinus ALCF2SS1-6]
MNDSEVSSSISYISSKLSSSCRSLTYTRYSMSPLIWKVGPLRQSHNFVIGHPVFAPCPIACSAFGFLYSSLILYHLANSTTVRTSGNGL